MSISSDELKGRSRPRIISALRSHLIGKFHELNLFDDDPFWSPILTYSEQIRSTRLCILLVSISVLIVFAYASLSVVKHDVTLEKFSLDDFERIERLHPHTIHVPCSEISISYNKFLNFSPIFYEVCSSPFIGNRWISSLFLSNATSHNILDFRTFGFAQYRSLRLLCRIARQAVKDAHRMFNFTHLIDRQAFSRIKFNEVSSVLLHNLQRNILTDQKQTVDVISTVTAQNRLMSALRTNYYLGSKPGSRDYDIYNGIYLTEDGTNNSTCDCRSNGNQCAYPAGAFYNWTLPELASPAKDQPPPRFQIPGLMAGCIPLDSMRQSTLECLYNQTCVNAISLQPEISQPKALNRSLTRFSLNSTIGTLFDRYLFVESWGNRSSFENYFSACAPRTLSYSYQDRFHLERMFTLTVSAFGGLIIGLKLLTPIFIKIFNFLKSKKQAEQPTTIELEILKIAPKPLRTVMITHVHRTIDNFNLYPSDKEDERIGIISTRLYLFLITFCLILLGIFTCLSKRDQTIVVNSPSISKFEELYSNYSSTLDCPCSRFSMSYDRIMSLSPRYHSICSSEYLEGYWLSYFGRVEIDVKKVKFLTLDFRVIGQSFFDLMKILCKTSNQTVENALLAFKTNRLVTMNTLSSEQFHIEIARRLKSFEEQTISSFVHLIQLIRSAIQTNQLAEAMWTNLGPFSIYDNQTSQWSLIFRPRSFYTNSCSCALSNECTRPMGFYFRGDNIYTKPNITIPGLVIGCYPIDSLLLSTLECLYEKKCVQLLIDNYYFDVVGLVHPLNPRAVRIEPLSSNNSRFFPNTTIDEIFSQLFVEDWINSSNYSSYYTRCQPSQCTYTIQKRFDTVYLVTIMLGFYGGLGAILDIILPPIVKIVLRQCIKRRPTSPWKDKLLSLNFFARDSSSNKHQEIIATRTYILLLLMTMILALLYYGPFNPERKSINLKNPSIDLVTNLHEKNLSSLSCPCSKVAIAYSKFLSIKPEFHSICSSDLISPSYRLNLFEKNTTKSLDLITHYRILSSLCSLSNQFLQNAEQVFNHRELITVETFTKDSFSIEIKSFIESFIRQTKSDYRRRLLFIVNSFSVNQLLNFFTNNWKIDFTDESEKYLIRTISTRLKSTNCTCAISSNCQEELTDQIQVGCLPYDGFRLSKYENISLEFLNKQLFVQQWINQTNYTGYFQTCQPLECQYTIRDKNNLFLMSTTLLGLYGGLTYCLHLIVGQSLLAYRWWTTRKS